MRTGTPNFMKERLREARDARGIDTLITLAALLGVNSSTVSRWEDGSSTPAPEKLLEIAEKLNVRPTYFLREPLGHGDGPTFFRSLASARKRELRRQLARLRWLQEISTILQHYATLPVVNLPDLLNGETYRDLRDEDIERIAHDLRLHWGLGEQPIPNVIETLEHAGFIIGCDEMGTTALDGLCNWSELDQRPYILLANDKMSFFRRQMDAAHEMAHAVLHRDVSAEELRRDFKIIEKQAFRLASAFLMPATTFALAAKSPTLAKLLTIKDRWRVSVKAMIKRCRDLHLISNEEERQLYKYYSAKGWSREEPLDQIEPVAKPRLLAQALGMIVDAGKRTKPELLASEFTIPAKDVEELVGLSEGWFSDRTGEVVTLRTGAGRIRKDGHFVGEVINFPEPLKFADGD